MIDILDTLVGIVIIVDVYVIIFFRLLVRRDYERTSGNKESMFDVILSAPKKDKLSPSGQALLRKYWMALGIMGLCFVYVAVTRLPSGDFFTSIG